MLRRPVALDALLEALDRVDRLVLLGDVLELLEGRPRRAMDVAEPVLRAVGGRLGSGREVIVVPGNHDAALHMVRAPPITPARPRTRLPAPSGESVIRRSSVSSARSASSSVVRRSPAVARRTTIGAETSARS